MDLKNFILIESFSLFFSLRAVALFSSLSALFINSRLGYEDSDESSSSLAEVSWVPAPAPLRRNPNFFSADFEFFLFYSYFSLLVFSPKFSKQTRFKYRSKKKKKIFIPLSDSDFLWTVLIWFLWDETHLLPCVLMLLAVLSWNRFGFGIWLDRLWRVWCGFFDVEMLCPTVIRVCLFGYAGLWWIFGFGFVRFLAVLWIFLAPHLMIAGFVFYSDKFRD